MGEDTHFVVVEGERRRCLPGDAITLGRQRGAQVVLRHPKVSRIHAAITFKDGAFLLRDAGGTHGTYLGGRRIVEAVLRSGDAFVLGPMPEDGAQTEDSKLQSVQVSIEAHVCTLILQAPALAGAPGALKGAEPALSIDALIVSVPTRSKVTERGSRWAPTSDIAPRFLRRWLSFVLFGLSLAAGLFALNGERPEYLTLGSLTKAHQSEGFRKLAGPGAACPHCHAAWKGVQDAACIRCHRIEISEPHRKSAPGCPCCHREHGQETGTQRSIVPRHRCTDCHPHAHTEGVGAEPEPTQEAFLNRSFSRPLVHADHRPLECTRCHAKGDGKKTGPVITQCHDCHGGRQGMADARCLTCHHFHIKLH